VRPHPGDPFARSGRPVAFGNLGGEAAGYPRQRAERGRLRSLEGAYHRQRGLGVGGRTPRNARRPGQRPWDRGNPRARDREPGEAGPVAVSVDVRDRLEERASVQPDRAVVVRDRSEPAGLAEEEVELLAPAARKAHAARDDVCARRPLGTPQDLFGVRIELVPVVAYEHEFAVLLRGRSRARGGRQYVLPEGEGVLRVERLACGRCAVRQRAGQRIAQGGSRRLDEGASAILLGDELGPAALAARDERDAVLEALVDDVRRVVDE